MANGVSEGAIHKATGRLWDEWFEILDAAGATEWSHEEIATHLQEDHNLSPWWSQMVAVEYEQVRGLRDEHEKPDGYEIGKSKTVNVPLKTLYEAWAIETLRNKWLPDVTLKIRKAQPTESMRITWTDGESSLDVNFKSKGENKSQVTLQHGKLPDSAAAEDMKSYWGERLKAMKQVVES